ncbi:Breast cancer 1, early onset [Cichlidogyrus casuarinus]|uniref:Breast cancer 1, early onset n=1 Tax=Cichlidogyrus casuarinus TaxID=1844966 RepID=A0ABD2QKS9_9PLAT
MEIDEITKCITILTQAVKCCICLDTCKTPVSTYCGHTFCLHCINEYLGKKRSAPCPSCRKEFKKRSLRPSTRLNEISKAVDAVIAAYQKETNRSFEPDTTPASALHLSQEMTQFASRFQRSTEIEEEPSTQPMKTKPTINKPPLPTLLKRKRNQPIPVPSDDMQFVDDDSETGSATSKSRRRPKKFKRSTSSSLTRLSKQISLPRITRLSSKSESSSPKKGFSLRKFRSFDPSNASPTKKLSFKSRVGSFVSSSPYAKLRSKFLRRNSDSFVNTRGLAIVDGSEEDISLVRSSSVDKLTAEVKLVKVSSTTEENAKPPLPTFRSRSTCKFIAPLKGLISRRKSHQHRRHSLLVQNQSTSRVSLNSVDSLVRSPAWSIDSLKTDCFQCSACGETLHLLPTDLDRPSTSASYWHAEDPDEGDLCVTSKEAQAPRPRMGMASVLSQQMTDSEMGDFFTPQEIIPESPQMLVPETAETPEQSQPTEIPETVFSTPMENKENVPERHFSTPIEEIKDKRISLTGSGLNVEGNRMLAEFAKRFSADKRNRFEVGETTHVVMMPSGEGRRVVARTFKYFMGILNHCWIVNVEWLRESLKRDEMASEEEFEVTGDTVCGDAHGGPKRSRLSVPLRIGAPNTAIFAHMNLCVFGELPGLSMKDFAQLVECGSGTFIPSLAEMPKTLPVTGVSARSSSQRKNLIIVHEGEERTRGNELQLLYARHHIPFISIDWFYNCISLYRRLSSVDQYYVYPKKSTAIRNAINN